MPVSKLKTLKIRVDHLLIGVGGLVALVVALLGARALLRPDPKHGELEQGLERIRDNQRPAGTSTPRFVRGFHASARPGADEQGEGIAVRPPPPHADPGDLGPDEAVDSFKQVLAELEAAVESDRVLSEREQAELYNRATGSFTVLSAWTDTSDPGERALMDDAYMQMKSLLRELDIRPPAHDPDYNPVRR